MSTQVAPASAQVVWSLMKSPRDSLRDTLCDRIYYLVYTRHPPCSSQFAGLAPELSLSQGFVRCLSTKMPHQLKHTHILPQNPAAQLNGWRRDQLQRRHCWRHLQRNPAGQVHVQARHWHPHESVAAPAALLSLDPLAMQRAELGGRVVRHLAGIEQTRELDDAIRLLPVRVEAPRAWRTLTTGVAAKGVAGLRAALAPRHYPIPSFHTLAHCRCQLTSSTVGRRFRARPINLFLSLLFQQVPAAVALAGLPPVLLNRFDLHHAHLFYSPSCRQLGLLLHAKEYPASYAEAFPVHLGNCQAGSSLAFEEEEMRWRNILWLDGWLACLDMAAPALQPLLMPGLELPRTVLEHDLGLPLADVNFFSELQGRKPPERLFVCLPGD